MFPKNQRVSADLHNRLIHGGKRLSSEHFSLKFFSNPDKKPSQNLFSVVVSKKIEKNAVDRNTTRRRLYPIIKKLSKDWETKGNVFILYVQKSILSCLPPELNQEIDFLLKKAKI